MRQSKPLPLEQRAPQSSWKVGPVESPADQKSRLGPVARWLRRREPTLYQRCLAVHIYYAGKQTTLQ